jgi:fatty-acyl-CoA synthase
MIEPQKATNRIPARDVLDAWARALTLTAKVDENPHRLLPDVIQDFADANGDAIAVVSVEAYLSYRSLAETINQYSRWALDQNIQKGDVVCLLMQNHPDYLAIWLGITRVGGVVALINDRIFGETLAHCIRIVEPVLVIAPWQAHKAVVDARTDLGASFSLWVHGGDLSGIARIDADAARHSGERLSSAESRPMDISDRALCIYTSGTTGLPKAANVSHRRLMTWSYWFSGLIAVQPSDRMYNCLPMHHSTGGVVAVGSMLVSGASVVLREKFSAHDFWDDVIRSDCTLFQYIGELCRYLVNTPVSPAEARHNIRLCCGNGLRADVWTQFKERFRIPQILEFYAASEGSFSMFNVEGKPGAIGRVPGFLNHRFPAEIVKFDVEHETPIRDERGLCIRCGKNEVGEAIGRLEQRGGIAASFEGYSNPYDSERKILRNVFAEGDAWFRTGDLMYRDDQNFFYFVDRIGDTFRWKGENVSTTQVAEVLCSVPGVSEALVYGVGVPGTEGRAGMAALIVEPSFDLGKFRALIKTLLPSFARPRFLRLPEQFATTATFKFQKQDLKRDGYDLSRISDPLYVDDTVRDKYVLLDPHLAGRIQRGEIVL